MSGEERLLLAQLLALADLIAGTCWYAEIVRRRRALRAIRQKSEELGLHGLVRVLLADADGPPVMDEAA